MATFGQFLSQTRQAAILPFETAARPLVGFAEDYPSGLETGPHTHPRAQLLYAVSGVMRIETDSIAYVVPPTTALFLGANVPHSVRMEGPVALRELFLREDAVARIAVKSAVIVVSPLLRELIQAACAEPIEWDPSGRGHHLMELIIDEIARATPLTLGLPMPRDPRLLRLVSILRRRPDDPRGLEELAHEAGASSRTLARLFRAEIGFGFRRWRQQMRMAEALNALVKGATPARAAVQAGFAGQPAFGAAFRACLGLTPGQARALGKTRINSAAALDGTERR